MRESLIRSKLVEHLKYKFTFSMQQERPQKVLRTHFLSASFNTVALPRQRGCRVSNMHTDTPCTTYWCLWNIYSKLTFTLANIRVHTPCSCNKPAYKWKKSLWALEQSLVEEWLKLQLNTPLNNVRVQAWVEVLRMGLQRWKAFSVPDATLPVANSPISSVMAVIY